MSTPPTRETLPQAEFMQLGGSEKVMSGKTAFSTISSHCEYLVSSVFQAFINKVLQEYLGSSVIIYLYGILVYLPSLKHVHNQILCTLQR
ncbi:hypothetical protein P4O66_016751, partial [Electrophorus voltai]